MLDASIDYKAAGKTLDLQLLRAVALGGKRSADIGLLLDSQKSGKADYQALALAVADLSVSEQQANLTFQALGAHQERLAGQLGRDLGIKTAALDLVENIERALKLEDGVEQPSYFQLEQMAFHDQLTGLYNYRAFGRRLEDEFRRAKRYRHPVSLVMLDIDRFKAFNDTFGHPAGNEALRAMAGLLTEAVRETDVVSRYGGEEFAILLPETSKRLTTDMAARVRAAVEAHPILMPDGKTSQRLTISLGVATYPRDAWSRESLVEAADAALYESKHQGRNRVTAFKPAGEALFRYRPEPKAKVKTLSIVGDFNGWDPQADPMPLQDDGSFSGSIRLIPGDYEYKFVVNNQLWIQDPLSAEKVGDGYGGQNSLLHLKAV